MTDESDLQLARECDSAASVEAGRKMLNDERLLPHGTQSALLAIKAERARRDAQTAAWLRASSNRARTAVSLADAIERGEHVRQGEGR